MTTDRKRPRGARPAPRPPGGPGGAPGGAGRSAGPRSASGGGAGGSESVVDRQWVVPAELAGAPIDRALRTLDGGTSWGDVRRLIRMGHVLVDGEVWSDATALVGAGVEVRVARRPSEHRRAPPTTRESGVPSAELAAASRGIVLHLDSQLVVVDKPAGVSTVPYDESELDTLDRRVGQLIARGGQRARLLCVHRLDKETTGVLVFARTQHALERLKSQFRFKTTERRYLALVHGDIGDRRIESRLVKDRGDGLRGSTRNPRLGREARTDVRVLERLRGATLVECRLGTGRTHQIRIHLAEAGHPVVGERVYIRGYGGTVLEAPRVMLHAAELGFEHPAGGERLRFEAPLPRDFQAVLRRLQGA